MKTHMTGVLSHGYKLVWCFVDFLRCPQDSNPTINCLISCLRHLKNMVGGTFFCCICSPQVFSYLYKYVCCTHWLDKKICIFIRTETKRNDHATTFGWTQLFKTQFKNFFYYLINPQKNDYRPCSICNWTTNCFRDCKNIHILGFCALLVKAGVFRKLSIFGFACIINNMMLAGR